MRWNFDNHGTEKENYIEYIELELVDQVRVVADGVEVMHLTADRDQWGVYISGSADFCIAQEDETRSFLGSLMSAMAMLQKNSEHPGNTVESRQETPE